MDAVANELRLAAYAADDAYHAELVRVYGRAADEAWHAATVAA